jgi:TonB family protein
MKKAGIIIASLALLPIWWASPAAGISATVSRVVEWEMKLRVFEGVREGLPPAPSVVTASFLKYTFSANFRSDEESTEEQVQIKRIFNLKDVKLLTEGDLIWKAGMPAKVPYVFRLDGREYSIRVRGADFITREGGIGTQTFGIEVFEQTKREATDEVKEARNPISGVQQAGLLDTEFTVSTLKNVTVFGFEDSQGRPYFISLQQTGMYAEEPAAAAAAGGAVKGVGGGVAGDVESRKSGDVIVLPKLIKRVQPAYPKEARKSRISGIVVIEGTTDVNGKVVAARILKSVPGLDQAAIDAVKQWVYEPMIINGRPRPVVFTTTLRFSLLDEGATAAAGVESGVTGELEGGVTGVVEGGVEGGLEGGITGAVEGEVEGGLAGSKQGEAGKEVIRASGKIKPPERVKLVNPVYPEIARQAQVEGTVILEATTDEKGDVVSVKVLRSVPVLDQAAVDAVRQWKYAPMIIDGKPRKVVFTVTVRFKLNPSEKEKAFYEFALGAVRAEGDIKPPQPLKIVEPVYPPEAVKAGIEGTVILAVKTDAAGKVEDAMILRSIPALNQAAIDAVKQWVYEPLVIEGIPRPVVFTVTVRFQKPEKTQIKKEPDGRPLSL